MTDYRQKLLDSSGLREDLESKLQKLQSQNDALQRSLDIDDDDKREFYIQLKLQKESFNEFILEIKDQLMVFEKQSKGIEGKNRFKRVKDWYLKEVNRNRSIFQQLYSKSSFESKISEAPEQTNEPIQPVTVVTTNYPGKMQPRIKQIQYSTGQESQLYNANADLESQLFRQNQEDINHINMNAKVLHKVAQDIQNEVHYQDQQLDIVYDLHIKAKDNIVNANDEISEANEQSRGGKKMYIIFLLVVVIMTLIVITVLYATGNLDI